MPTNETELELNPDVLKEQGGDYSSLTDLYGVKVFSDDFTKQVQTLSRQQKEKTESSIQSIFVSDHYRRSAPNSYETLLFQSTAQAEKIQTYENTDSRQYTQIGMGLTTALLFVAGIYYLMNKMPGRDKERQNGEGAKI